MKYVGSRYVPKFIDDPHDPNLPYEVLSVLDGGMGISYISDKPVPGNQNIPLTDTEYWHIYGASNGAIINLQNQIDAHTLQITDLQKYDTDLKIYNVMAYGATGDGTTDDTASINDAVADMPSGGAILYFPAGRYRITDAIHVDKKAIVCGEGGATILSMDATTAQLFVDANYSAVRDLTFVPTVNGAGATALKLTGSMFHVENCNITQFNYNCHLEGCSNVYFEQCYFTTPTVASILIENPGSPDTGDHTIIGCTFDSSAQTSKAILFHSGGGMRISGCKFLHHATQIDIAPDTGVNTSVLLIEGNSFEASETQAIQLGGSAGTFSKINITANQFSVKTHAIRLLTNTAHAKISNNIIEKTVSDSSAAFVLSGCEHITINDNTISGFSIKTQALTRVSHLNLYDNKGDCTMPFSLSQLFQDATELREEVRKDISDNTGTVSLGAIVLPNASSAQLDIDLFGSISGVGLVNKKISFLIGYNSSTYQIETISDKYTSNDATISISSAGAISLTYTGTSITAYCHMIVTGQPNVLTTA